MRVSLGLLLTCSAVVLSSPLPQEDQREASFQLHSLHSDDFHVSSEETDPCESGSGSCYGGIARLTSQDQTRMGSLTSDDEVKSVAEVAARLNERGVDIIVAVSHAEIDIEQEMVGKMQDDDVIVGGDIHAPLSTGQPPDSDVAEDVYPVLVAQDSGDKMAVVQADISRNPVLRDEQVPKDEAKLKDLIPGRKVVEETGSRVVGHTSVLLNASNFVCRGYECNIGNFLTDAMVDENVVTGQQGLWTRAAVALMDAGSIRASIDEIKNAGNVTYGDLLSACPFGDTIDTVTMKGSTLLEVLEASVNDSTINTEELNGVNITTHYAGGNFLQQSGLHVVFDLRRHWGSRVVNVMVRCAECRVPRYEPLQADGWYSVAITSFMAKSRDSYHMLHDSVVNHTVGRLDTDVFIDYMKKNNPITHGIDGRTVVLY